MIEVLKGTTSRAHSIVLKGELQRERKQLSRTDVQVVGQFQPSISGCVCYLTSVGDAMGFPIIPLPKITKT